MDKVVSCTRTDSATSLSLSLLFHFNFSSVQCPSLSCCCCCYHFPLVNFSSSPSKKTTWRACSSSNISRVILSLSLFSCKYPQSSALVLPLFLLLFFLFSAPGEAAQPTKGQRSETGRQAGRQAVSHLGERERERKRF